ncbi:hypothetical protein BJ878DRAFT_487663 [Calycina marina]|uniref:Uncharacterized protein n=1 Tax=Calycina marina TaxID=1763456 RepID=A0A9P7ZBL8_9HELO|nr:hypothetical protein BJ878DRAFT_487663 [Calycina marina]
MEEAREKTKSRLKGFFGKDKERKSGDGTGADINAFLHGNSDTLNFPAPTPSSPTSPQSPPRLTKIDTNSARRWPTAAAIQNARGTKSRAATTGPTRTGRKEVVVRFAEAKPEIIGEGGEEAKDPTITLRRRANTHPQSGKVENNGAAQNVLPPMDFRLPPMRRSPTSFIQSNDPASASPIPQHGPLGLIVDTQESSSFAEKVKAEMREAEGRLLAASETSRALHEQIEHVQTSCANSDHVLDEALINAMKNTQMAAPANSPPQLLPRRSTGSADSNNGTNGHMPYPLTRSSAAAMYENQAPSRGASVKSTNTTFESPQQLTRSSTLALQAATVALGDEALELFFNRTSHLLSLFRLSSESNRPLSNYSLAQFMRVSLWWFLQGRLNLEATIRDKPTSPETEQRTFHIRQQAYTDLAKSLWIIEKVVPEYYNLATYQDSTDAKIGDIMDVQKGIMSGLRKLAISMERNNFLPPEDAPLPHGLDPAIWLQDDGNTALPAVQKPVSRSILDSMPIGDSRRYFQLARMFSNCVLSEETESQTYKSLMLVSLVRAVDSRVLTLVVTNQSGTYTVCVTEDGKLGATWNDVAWYAQSYSVEVKLPRGFKLLIGCTQQDFKTLCSSFDYARKIYDGLRQMKDERLIYESTLKSMQYIDTLASSGFLTEPLPQCRLKIFEKVAVEKVAAMTRIMHRGYRIAVVTHPSTKTLRSVNQHLRSYLPILFDFLRGDGGFPGFRLAIEDGKLSCKLLFTFNDAKERMMFHDCLTAAARGDEVVTTEVSLKLLDIESNSGQESRFLKLLPWQSAKVINCGPDNSQNVHTVRSDNLRMVIGFGIGSLTDRLNVDQGELKIRASVTTPNELKILRIPQRDMTCSTLESKGTKETYQHFVRLLDDTRKSETTRTYTFASITDLHHFQAALTGFGVIFDGMATSFNISRRRMVVPIYKKWDAMISRLQIVQKDTHIQLLAFFEHFSHGDCMSFTLKSTDVFESSGKAGKWSIRIVNAKFALPKGHGEEKRPAESAFVCLDSPEYPGEHDDITIIFEREAGKSSFCCS